MYNPLSRLDELVIGDGYSPRMDDVSPSIFVGNQATQIIQRNYERRFPNLRAKEFIPPADDGISPNLPTWGYEQTETRGKAQWLAHNATDVPRVDTSATQRTHNVRAAWLAAGWDLFQIRAAIEARRPLSERKFSAVRRGLAEFEDDVLLRGDASRNIPGFLTSADVPRFGLPTGNWTSSTTGAAMLADLTALANRVPAQTGEANIATTLGLPLVKWQLAMQTLLNATSTVTVAEFFLKTNGYVTELVSIPALATAGPGGTPTSIAYQKSPENLGYVVPTPYEQLPPQVANLETVVISLLVVGGTAWFQPSSAVFGDGI